MCHKRTVSMISWIQLSVFCVFVFLPTCVTLSISPVPSGMGMVLTNKRFSWVCGMSGSLACVADSVAA